MAKTEVVKNIWGKGYKRTNQRGFAGLVTQPHQLGDFWFTIGKVKIESTPKVAYRLYRFLKHHYGK